MPTEEYHLTYSSPNDSDRASACSSTSDVPRGSKNSFSKFHPKGLAGQLGKLGTYTVALSPCGLGFKTRKLLWALLIIYVSASLGIIIWLALVLTVKNRLRIPSPQSGLQQIVHRYRPPTEISPASPLWLSGFSDDILPQPCHSHNDYQHRVPLYEGLAAGCTSTEADIWVRSRTDGSTDLLIGHNSKSLSESRTLQSLYLDPLREIITQLQSSSSVELSDQKPITASTPVGIFTMAPETTLVLLLDFKMSGDLIWETVNSQLSYFRFSGWLSHWTPDTGFVTCPLTIVASGDASFDLITTNSTYRDIFYDAPLTSLSSVDDKFNGNNSYYASASLGSVVGRTVFDLNNGQKDKIRTQVQRAEEMGLKSRFWDTPSWPVGWRNRVWNTLIKLGAAVLNVDDLVAGARWDWQLCVVAGVNICD